MIRWFAIALLACAASAETKFAIVGNPTDKNVQAYRATLGAVELPHTLAGPKQDLDDYNALVIPAAAVATLDGPAVQRILAQVNQGTLLVTEGFTPLTLALGVSPGDKVKVQQIEDVVDPQVQILWAKSVELGRATLPGSAKILAKEKYSAAPAVATFLFGKGRVLWLGAELDPEHGQGYARFPYLIQHLVRECGVLLPYRSSRLHAFFDYGYRTGVDLEFFARRWHRQGIAALHVSAWHFYDREHDDYLRRLIAACHSSGIVVYAWLELPHVSERTWEQHPEWREKTAQLADARLDWRGHINLLDPRAMAAVSQGLRALLQDFDWDGVNLAELYFESPRGPEVPSRFTPMNDLVRAEFRASAGFDPLELFRADSPHYWHTDSAGWRKFVDYRAGLVVRLNEQILTVVAAKPHFDVLITAVENLTDKTVRDNTGSDVAAMRKLAGKFNARLILEDPAALWAMGPDRYRELATRFNAPAGVDINIVERYQETFPTKKQTGTEFLSLLHSAAESFSPVLVYFEQSVYPQDMDLAAFSLARMDQPVEFRAGKGRVLVDGAEWPVRDGDFVSLPAGKHNVQSMPGNPPPVSLFSLNGELLDAAYDGTRAFHFRYRSRSRSVALYSARPSSVLVDDKPLAEGQLLPPGEHEVRVRF